MPSAQPDNSGPSSPCYIMPATATYAGNDAPAFSDIKIICTQRKKKHKSDIYLTFVESRSISSNEPPCIEVLGKSKIPPMFLDDCISFETFNATKNDHQSFIYIYFESDTVSIHFPDEHIEKKPVIIKYLEYLYQKNDDIPPHQSLSDLPCLSTTEEILHTFDVKLIPYENIITREHSLVGPARIYFTTTDLYIASRHCNRMELKTTISNQCPTTNNNILCIPYFTIKHYGNRSNIFLIELGKSNYGNGEIRMKCLSASLASTIHLLVSPVIEERPLALSSAFRNQFLAARRVEKSKSLQPPVQLNSDPLTRYPKMYSVESLPEPPTRKKSRSVFGLFRKLVKTNESLQRSCTLVDRENSRKLSLQPFANKYFAFNRNERKYFQDRMAVTSSESLATNNGISFASLDQPDTDGGSYIDMGPIFYRRSPTKTEETEEEDEEEIIREPTATAEIGVNTTISLSPHVHSAIIVGSSAHLLAEESTIYPIGQRSFTSPASVLQPFKAQLNGQPSATSTSATNSSNSCHQSTSSTDPNESLLLSYGIVTFNNNSLLTNRSSYASDGSILDRRLNSQHSLISISTQEQPSSLFSYDKILSSSSSRIFGTLSVSNNNICDSISGHFRASNGNIIFFDENFPEQTTTYLLGAPPAPFIDETNQSLSNKSISRSLSTYTDKGMCSPDDPYALVEPISKDRSPVASLSRVSTAPILPSQKSIIYTDVYVPLNSDGNAQCDLIDEREEHSPTIFYTDIDFYQIQRRNRIAQLAAISKLKDQMPPFVL